MKKSKSYQKAVILTICFLIILFIILANIYFEKAINTTSKEQPVIVNFYKAQENDEKDAKVFKNVQKSALAGKQEAQNNQSKKGAEYKSETDVGELPGSDKPTLGGDNKDNNGGDNGNSDKRGKGESSNNPVNGNDEKSHFTKPQIIKRVSPRYPQTAIEKGLSGSVTVQAKITTTGRSTDINVIASSGYPELDQAVVNAISKWRFSPARNMNTGVAVTGIVNLTVQFNLKNN